MGCVQSYPPKTAEECREILSRVDIVNPIIALMLECSALTGLRYSDVSKLKVSDLFVNGQIRDDVTIIQQKPLNKRLSSGQKASSAKEASKVKIHINQQCADLIVDAVRINGVDLLTGGAKLIFASSVKAKQPFSIQYINRLLKRVAFEMKLKYPLSTHSFRKMFAMIIVKKGASVHQIRDALGQSSLAATDHYLRTFLSETKEFTDDISF